MQKPFLTALFLAASLLASAQQTVTVIPKSQIDQGLDLPTKAIDRMIRVVDVGAGQLGVAVAKHEANAGRPSVATGRTPNSVACGTTVAPSSTSATPGPGDGIWHDNVTEMYVILEGSGTLVTGGTILNGFRSSPDSDTDRIETGSSCIGPMVGSLVRQQVSKGDIVIIPAGVAHGWENLHAEITYIDVRTDPKKILQHGYVNPGIH